MERITEAEARDEDISSGVEFPNLRSARTLPWTVDFNVIYKSTARPLRPLLHVGEEACFRTID